MQFLWRHNGLVSYLMLRAMHQFESEREINTVDEKI